MNKRNPIYARWINMIQRCTNPNNPKYYIYGGRGITVCESWRNFINFYNDMGDCPENYTLDRIDTNGNYEPSNCRWATQYTQQNNRSNNLKLTFCGETLSVTEWARRLGTSHKTITYRLNNGWPVDKALSVKPKLGRNQYSANK